MSDTKHNNPRGNQSFGKGRMEAFSDAVFAIAITLLVLEIAVHPPGTLLEQVIEAWPSYVAYLISFLTIGAAWLAHAALTEHMDRVDSVFLRLNLLVLMVVSFLPFPTRLVAENLVVTDDVRVAVTIYGFTLLAIRIIGSLMVAYAERERLMSPREEGSEIKRESRNLPRVLAAYVAAIVVGLVFPRLAVALYFGLAIYLVMPLRQVVRSLSKG